MTSYKKNMPVITVYIRSEVGDTAFIREKKAMLKAG